MFLQVISQVREMYRCYWVTVIYIYLDDYTITLLYIFIHCPFFESRVSPNEDRDSYEKYKIENMRTSPTNETDLTG